jgi:MFS family permease
MSLSALRDAGRFVLTQPIILSVMALDFGATLFGLPNALFPVYARDILHAGPAGLGVLYAATSLGAIVGGIAMSIVGNVRRPGIGILIGVAVYAIGNILFAMSGDLWLSAVLLAIAGLGNAVSAVLRWTLVQVVTPDALRGRVSAVGSIFTSGGPRLGEFRAGAVAQVWGAEMSALSGGLITLLLVAGVAAPATVRRFRMAPPVREPVLVGSR